MTDTKRGQTAITDKWHTQHSHDNAELQGVAKNPPLQKSHYFQHNLMLFGELFRGYSRDILPLVLQILAILL